MTEAPHTTNDVAEVLDALNLHGVPGNVAEWEARAVWTIAGFLIASGHVPADASLRHVLSLAAAVLTSVPGVE